MVCSLPGPGTILGARSRRVRRVPGRYATAKSRRNYAGTSPITRPRAPGAPSWPATPATSASPTRTYLWAFSAISDSPGARAFYDHHRAAGDTHHPALRALGNRLVGILHGCLARHAALQRNHRPGPPHRPNNQAA